MKDLLKTAKRSRKVQRLRQLLDRALDQVRGTLAPGPRLQPVPVRIKRRKD
jgi:hypothetical protein